MLIKQGSDDMHHMTQHGAYKGAGVDHLLDQCAKHTCIVQMGVDELVNLQHRCNVHLRPV